MQLVIVFIINKIENSKKDLVDTNLQRFSNWHFGPVHMMIQSSDNNLNPREMLSNEGR